MMDVHDLKRKVAAIKAEAIACRRYLHQHPELSFCEYETSKYIQRYLSKENIPFEIVANTGVVAHIVGNKTISNDAVILRADIDALPIQELNESDYDSVFPNTMHACGHDFHTANLLSVLKILKEVQHEFAGHIIAVFQPAEEKIPGGAQSVIASGILEKDSLVIKGVLGIHVSPKIEVGKVGIRGGKFMASSDEFFITIKGKGGHGAQPHLNTDPVVIASQLVISLQQIVSRVANPSIPSVLSIGKFIANGATNVIPDVVHLEGTFRTMDEKWREKALELIVYQICELPKIFGAEVDLELRRGYPALINDSNLASDVKDSLIEYLGNVAVDEADIWMAAEDFAYYTQKYPAVFFLVGIANESKGITSELHTPTFKIDEEAFEQSVGGMLYAALKLLEA